VEVITSWSAGCREIVNWALAVCGMDPRLSVTWMLTVETPFPVGTPEMRPPGDRLRPAGSMPLETAHWYGDTPPAAVRTTLTDLPCVAEMFVGAVIDSLGAGTTLRVSAFVADWATGDDESVAFTVTVEVAPVGTPLMVPSEDSPSPAGSDPAEIDQWTTPNDPDVASKAV